MHGSTIASSPAPNRPAVRSSGLRPNGYLCEPEAEQEGGNFIDGGCTRDQRRGIAFLLENSEATLLDRTSGTVGPLDVYVGRTVGHVEIFCTDTPKGWAEFVAIRP